MCNGIKRPNYTIYLHTCTHSVQKEAADACTHTRAPLRSRFASASSGRKTSTTRSLPTLPPPLLQPLLQRCSGSGGRTRRRTRRTRRCRIRRRSRRRVRCRRRRRSRRRFPTGTNLPSPRCNLVPPPQSDLPPTASLRQRGGLADRLLRRRAPVAVAAARAVLPLLRPPGSAHAPATHSPVFAKCVAGRGSTEQL